MPSPSKTKKPVQLPGYLGVLQKKHRKYVKNTPKSIRGRREILIAATIAYIIIMYFVIQAEAAKASYLNSSGYYIGEILFYINHHPFSLPPLNRSMLTAFLITTLLYGLVIVMVVAEQRLRAHADDKTAVAPAQWMTEDDLEEYNATHKDPDFFKNMIISNELYMSIDPDHNPLPLNMLCIAGTGKGKSFRVVGPNLLQANASYIVTDPSGDLYSQYGTFLEYMGYKVKCLNLNHMDQSNHYNPFNYIHSDKDIVSFANALVVNTNDPNSKGGEKFWDDCTVNLYCAFIAYLYHYGEKESQNMTMVMQMIRDAQVKEDDETFTSPVDNLFDQIENKETDFAYTQYQNFKIGAGKTLKSILISAAARIRVFDLADVQEMTSSDDIDLDSVPDEKTAIFVIIPTMDRTFNFIAALCYTQMFRLLYDYSENLAQYGQYLKDANGNMVKVFRAKNVEEAQKGEVKRRAEEYLKEKVMTATVQLDRPLELTDPTNKKQEIYNIIAADGTKIGFRGSRQLAEEALAAMKGGTIEPTNKLSNSGRRCPFHVSFLLDEFANTGKIPDFLPLISTVRKYQLSLLIILQSLTQIKDMYPKDWSTITANCDTISYLGGGADLDTQKQWLEELLGKETRIVQSSSFSGKGGSSSYQKQAVALYSATEMRTMEAGDCIVIISGEPSYIGPMYDTPHHPYWNLATKKLPRYRYDSARSARLFSLAIKTDAGGTVVGGEQGKEESPIEKKGRECINQLDEMKARLANLMYQDIKSQDKDVSGVEVIGPDGYDSLGYDFFGGKIQAPDESATDESIALDFGVDGGIDIGEMDGSSPQFSERNGDFSQTSGTESSGDNDSRDTEGAEQNVYGSTNVSFDSQDSNAASGGSSSPTSEDYNGFGVGDEDGFPGDENSFDGSTGQGTDFSE